MRICPACRQTYSDDSLNFCLNDGAALAVANTRETAATERFAHAQTQPNARAGQNFAHPNAAGKRNKSLIGVICAVGVLAGLTLVCGGGIFSYYANNLNAANALVSNVQPVNKNAAPINQNKKSNSEPTLADYNQIKNGMSYKQVEVVIGSPGTEMSSTEYGEYKTQTYKWDGENYAMLYAVFQNDKLISKTQNNLK